MKNNYFIYNVKGIARSLIPSIFLPKDREKILRDLDKRADLDYIKKRVDYYCKLNEAFCLDSSAWQLKDLRWTRKKTVYFFDSYEYAMYFPQDFRANFEFGDVNYVCEKPSITKSRPIDESNSSLTQSLREIEKPSIDRRQALSQSAFSTQPTNLTQDTRIANDDLSANARIFVESQRDSSDSIESSENNPVFASETKQTAHLSSLRGQRQKQSIYDSIENDFKDSIDCLVPNGLRNDGMSADSIDSIVFHDSAIAESRNDKRHIQIQGNSHNDKVGDSPQPPFANSTLLNLEKIRHFTFINDPYNFDDKIPKLFYRGGIYQSHRVKFFWQYFNHPLCDLGHTGSKSVHKQWQKPKISIAEHLPYKFLLSLEGNDVASNLKWAMSSNSLVFSPKPKFETWFMEGTLIGGVHFVEIKPDYSDLEEKLEYFIANPNKAKEIIHNAHIYCKQFFDKRREDIISLLVLEKYFYYAGQLEKMRI